MLQERARTETTPAHEAEVEPHTPTPKWKVVVPVILALVVLIVGIRLCTGRATQAGDSAQGGAGSAKGGKRPAVPVAVAPVQQRDVPVVLEGLGNVMASSTVTVKTRVDGQLMRFNFREGEHVHQGEELALIDPRPFQATLSQAEANRFKDLAQLENARRDLARFADLYKNGLIPQQQYDSQKALVAQEEGITHADDAQIEGARLNVTFCHIISPIDGTVGLRIVDPGNMVHASDQNGLIVITQLQPITVLFTLPEDDVTTVAQHLRAGPLTVEAWSRDNSQRVATGRLLTLDNEIDPNTGTVRLKAIFDNRDGALFPNQFVNARLQVDIRRNATTLPAPAIQRGSQGIYVYVVKPDKTVETRPVVISLTEGNVVVIDRGVSPGEQVVTDGQDKLQNGSQVEPHEEGAAGAGGGAPPGKGSPGQRPKRGVDKGAGKGAPGGSGA
jgi:multidrug efflux system membrane fusion protein